MPLYEYRCILCGRADEHNRIVSERDAKMTCYFCGGQCKRILMPAHLHGSPNMPNG